MTMMIAVSEIGPALFFCPMCQCGESMDSESAVNKELHIPCHQAYSEVLVLHPRRRCLAFFKSHLNILPRNAATDPCNTASPVY